MEKAEFGAFVAENRRRLGLTQKALADRLHVTDKAVSKWERGLSYPDVTLLEPLAAVLGIDVSELVSARPRESPGEGETGVLALLDISGELLRREQRRRRRTLVLSVLAVLLALAALCILGDRRWPKESDILSVIHTEERGEELLLFAERDGHLLCLSYDREDRGALAGKIAEGQSLRADYRWDRKTYRGRLLSWESGGFPVGGPMGEVGAATDLNAEDGDALFGFPRVLMRIAQRRPNPYGEGYLSDYIFYRGDESDDWYLHADEELLRVSDCLGFADFSDGGFRTADTDGDGVRELLVRTPWPEKPCIVYRWTGEGMEELWLDAVPEEMKGPPV